MTDQTDPATIAVAVPRRATVAVVGLLATVIGATAGCHPTATALDPLLVGLAAGAAAIALVRAGWWPLVPALLVGALTFPSGAALACLAGITVSVAGLRVPRLEAARPIVVLGAVATVLHLSDLGPFGSSALLSVVLLGPGVVIGARRWTGGTRLRDLGSSRSRRTALVAVGGVAVVYLGLLGWAGRDLDQGVDGVEAAVDRAAAGDSAGAAAELEVASDRFSRAHTVLDGWWSAPVRAVPILSQHVRALDRVAAEGTDLSDTAVTTLQIARLEDLRSDEGRFDLPRMASLPDPLAVTAERIRTSRTTLETIDTDWLVAPLSHRLEALDSELATAAEDADEAGAALEVIPGLLGADGPRRYFIAFVTPAELRGSGGFVGSYAEVTATDGAVELARSGSISEAEAALPPEGVDLPGPKEYLDRYGRYDPGRLLRDVTLSPHFPYVGEVTGHVYDQTGRRLDGVISIDPFAVAALLRITGPVEVDGIDHPIGPEDAAEFLLEGSYAELPDSADQNQVLADLVEVTFDRLIEGELPGPQEVARALGPATREGRIRMWSPRPAEERFFADLGATGAFPSARPDHDFLALSSQNAGNNKLDTYQSRRVHYGVRIDANGRVRATVEVTIRNDVPLDRDLPDFVTGNRQGDPRGTNAMRLSLHTPHRLVRTRVDGRDVGFDPGREAGYRAYTVLVRVPPGGKLVVTYDLEGQLAPSDDYILDLAPQPTVHGDQLSIDVDGPGGSGGTWGPHDILGRRRITLARDR